MELKPKNNKKTNILMIVGLFFIAAIFASGYSCAASVSIIAPSNVSEKNTFTAVIVADNVSDFAGAQFSLNFNSSVVQVVGHSLGNLTNTGAYMANNTKNADGKDVILINNFLNPSAGSGSIVSVTFKVAGLEGTSTCLNLSNVFLSNSVPEPIPVVSVNNASVSVTSVTTFISVAAPSNVSENSVFSVSIDVYNVSDFAGAQFDLTFNSSVVQVVGHSLGNLTNAGASIINNTKNYAGEDVLLINNAGASSGSGSIAVVTFKVIGSGKSSTYLNLSNVKLSNSVPWQIPVAAVNNAAVAVTALPVVISVIAPSTFYLGRSFTAKIVLINVSDFAGAQFNLTFNSSVVRVTRHSTGNLTNTGASITNNTKNAEGKDVLLINNAGASSGSGSIVLVTFKVIGSAGSSTYLKLSCVKLSNSIPAQIPVSAVNNATVSFVSIPGDSDGNNLVNIFDVIWAEKIAVGLIGPSVGNADADCNGVVNIFDVIWIEKIAVGLPGKC